MENNLIPIRIKRQRLKGWRKPENCISVCRPSKWGNPYKIMGDMIYGDASHRRGKILSQWIIIENDNYDYSDLDKAVVDLYEQWILGNSDEHYIKPCPFTLEDIKTELKGHDLMCFCNLEKPCHADVLNKYANC